MAKSHPKSVTNSIGPTPHSRIIELNLGRLPCYNSNGCSCSLSEVPDAINITTTASSPGQAGPGRREAHVK